MAEKDSRAADAAWQKRIFKHNSSFYGDDLTMCTGQRRIRLLEIQPAAFGEPVSGVLTTETLEPGLEYDALSYAWGAQSSVYEISINDKPGFQVGYNVHCALQRIRQKGRSVKFWIDCICINQYDIRERGHQVSFMRGIHSSARQVCCWLGVCGSTDVGVDELEECDEHAITDHSTIEYATINSEFLYPIDLKCQRSFILHVDKGSYHWWGRIWTLQELCVAREVVFLVGPHRYNERAFEKIVFGLEFNDKPEWGIGCTGVADWLGDRLRARRDYLSRFASGGQFGNTLQNLLLRTMPCQATDPRDSLYALFPLCDYEPAITPDYGVSWSNLCTQTTFWLLKESGLDYLIIRRWSLYKEDAPSWALNFSAPESSLVSLLHENEACWQWDWERNRPMDLDISPESELRLDGSRLRIMASRLGHVETLARGHDDQQKDISPSDDSSSAARDSLTRSIYADWWGHVTDDSTLEELFARACRKSSEESVLKCIEIDDMEQGHDVYIGSEQDEAKLRNSLREKTFFRTTSGYTGASQSDEIREEDEVTFVRGLRYPVVLRPTGEKDCYRLVGRACILGTMHGEMRDCIDEEKHKMREIALV